MDSEKNGLGIVLTALIGIGLYVALRKTASLSKKAYRRLRPAK